jgi:hypothetical protein
VPLAGTSAYTRLGPGARREDRDADKTTLLRLSGQGEIADLVWEAPADFTAEHGRLLTAAIQAHQSGNLKQGEHLWQQVMAIWQQAWSANHQALQLTQDAGLTRFSPAKPQRWVIASFEHHTSRTAFGIRTSTTSSSRT